MKKYIQEILLVINLLLLLGLYGLIGYWYFYLNEDKLPITTENNLSIKVDSEKVDNIPKEETKKFVDIKGAVVKPGVYAINDDTILNDIISLAGGLQKNAYTRNLNLSKRLNSEMVIYVYTQDEYKKINEKELESEPEVKEEVIKEEDFVCVCECPEVDISACLNTGSTVIVPDDKEDNKEQKQEQNPEESEDSKVNINTSSIEVLMTLNGIGDAKAKKIIEYREANGIFEKIEDIKNVSGISEAIYEKIKNNIRV